MTRLLPLCLVLVALGALPAVDEGPAPRADTSGKPTGDAPVNKLCPVDGKPIDRAIQTVDAHVDKRVIWIGVCSDHCWHTVHADPAAFAKAALANGTVEPPRTDGAAEDATAKPAPVPRADPGQAGEPGRAAAAKVQERLSGSGDGKSR